MNLSQDIRVGGVVIKQGRSAVTATFHVHQVTRYSTELSASCSGVDPNGQEGESPPYSHLFSRFSSAECNRVLGTEMMVIVAAALTSSHATTAAARSGRWTGGRVFRRH